MTNNYDNEYRKLEQTRTLLNPQIISSKKGKIWQYFRDYNDVTLTNLEKRIKGNIILYKAPLVDIHGSNMTNWPTKNGDDIYIDEKFVSTKENANIVEQQLTHEVLHSLCRVDQNNMLFGRVIDDDNEYMMGINEAVTQMYTDEIEHFELPEKDDYLFFAKNVMRVMKNTLGPSDMANQYLNNDNNFENKFNELTDGKFNDFAFILNQIYTLDKQKYYSGITNSVEDVLLSSKSLILEFTTTLVKKVAVNDPNVYTRIKDDFPDNGFLDKLNLKQLSSSPETK